MSRNKARVVAMQSLFQLDTSQINVREVIVARADEENLDDTDRQYLECITNAVMDNRARVDDCIARYSIDWDLSRLGRVERAILRLAIGEILFIDDVPVNVAINEAVKLSKKFGSDQAAKFINGVLGKFSRDLNSDPETPRKTVNL